MTQAEDEDEEREEEDDFCDDDGSGDEADGPGVEAHVEDGMGGSVGGREVRSDEGDI